MTTLGLATGGAWTRVVRRPAAATIISYVLGKWREYADRYQDIGEPFHERDEPVLTEGLAAYLVKESEAGRQPIDGDFLSELRHYDLGSDGTPICIGRTDIEWRLYGFPCFTIEFKILDAGTVRVRRYLDQGLVKFIDGRYAPRAPEGAMCAFLRPGAEGVIDLLRDAITGAAEELRCFIAETPVLAPSQLAPTVAQFDTSHRRDEPAISPIHLAHVFIPLGREA